MSFSSSSWSPQNQWEGYQPNSNGLFSEGYGSYQNYANDNSYSVGSFSSAASGPSPWNNTQSSSPCSGFDLLTLVDDCREKAKQEIAQGIKADFSECPWLKNPEGKRGRPPQYSVDERYWAKWKNNWIYTQKQEMAKSIQKADQLRIQKTNQELKDEYFQLCLEAVSLSDNLCRHNHAIFEKFMENPEQQQQRICQCPENKF